jgi:FtsP/CotA-like multicopper oxidase with cupredoxin domain
MTPIDYTRRTLVRGISGLVGVTALSPTILLAACSDKTATAKSREKAAYHGITDGPFDVDIRLRAHPDTVPILSGSPSEVWRYTADRLSGPEDTVTLLGDSYCGPILRLRRGQRVRMRLENRLPEDTTVHWHGLHVPPEVDGQPRLPIKPGEDMTVAFDVVDRAGLYWYHPHPHGPDGGRVGFQSYAGLAGPLIIEDEAEQTLGLPAGDQEMILVLQDRSFAGDNELTFVGGMGSMMRGYFGDRVLVNGRPPTTRQLSTQPYRLRILNGSNARIYKLAWSDGRPVTVIGTGGGLLDTPQQRPYVTLAPAQRIDLWIDLSDAGVGDQLALVSDHYGSGMMDGRSVLPAGARFELLRLHIAQRVRAGRPLPETLNHELDTPRVTSRTPIRRFDLRMEMMRGFAINGRQFQGAVVADDEIVTLGDTEIWEFVNNSMMPHPMHVHGLQFAVIERHKSRGMRGWSGLDDGLVDAGRHDTVLVRPGERVRIALTFTDFEGLYLYHCHNMEHEDNGMMRYYKVRS